MTQSTDTSTSAPGIALQTLLCNANPAALRELIGPSIVDTLQGLDPDLASGNRLGELAVRLIEPSEALSNAEMRQRIIRVLSLPKARELGQRPGANDGRTLYDDLCAKAADSAALPVLHSFFGVVRDVRAPADSTPDATEASAGSALFGHQRAAADRVVHALDDAPRKIILLTSLGTDRAGPEELLALVRNHWHIENRLHYVRDFTYDEDRCRAYVRHLPRNLACLTNVAIAIVRCSGRFRYLPEANRHYAARAQDALDAILIAPTA